MKLSVIVPARNEAVVLEENLQLIVAQLEHGDELLVADGGSHDATRDIAAKYANRLIEGHCGRASQMNGAASVAFGEWLIFVHADTQLPKNFKRSLAGDWGFFPVQLADRQFMLRVVSWFINRRSALTHVATGDQCMFVRRDLFESVGGFPEIALMEDVALSKLLRARCAPYIAQNRVTTSARRWQKNGVWRTILLMWRLRWRYWRGEDPSVLARQYHG